VNNTRIGLACLVVTLVLLLACPSGQVAKADKDGAKKQAADKREKASLWMTKKLEYSQKILAGLTKGDFDLIKKNAQQMQVVGYLESWDRADMPDYRRQIRYYEDANKELIRQAEKGNLSGATLAYTQLTLSCVQCHSVIRDKKK